jgi:hypothetical protein
MLQIQRECEKRAHVCVLVFKLKRGAPINWKDPDGTKKLAVAI